MVARSPSSVASRTRLAPLLAPRPRQFRRGARRLRKGRQGAGASGAMDVTGSQEECCAKISPLMDPSEAMVVYFWAGWITGVLWRQSWNDTERRVYGDEHASCELHALRDNTGSNGSMSVVQ
jgi:hypothetical protein